MGSPAQRLESERAKFPAMQVDEILVWRAWLALHQSEYDRFDYNTRLGTDVDPGPDFPDNIRKSAIALNSLRVDAVGWRGQAATIFEVKRRAGPQNIGQLLTYKHMWMAAQLSPVAPALMLVFNTLSQHILGVAAASAIELSQVDVDFSSLAPQRLR
jgi:hypothetical protein